MHWLKMISVWPVQINSLINQIYMCYIIYFSTLSPAALLLGNIKLIFYQVVIKL